MSSFDPQNRLILCAIGTDMPEGPEVKVIADELHRVVSGLWIDRITVTDNYIDKIRPNSTTLIGILPLKVERIYTRGKRIIWDCWSFGSMNSRETESRYDQTGKPIHLVSFLAMEGSWRYRQGVFASLDRSEQSSHESDQSSHESDQSSHTCLTLHICSWILLSSNRSIYISHFDLFYNDTLRWGTLSIVSPENLKSALSDIGPDLLSDRIELSQYRSILSRPRIAKMEISKFLLEQKYLSGIGNYLKSEILYRCRIAPMRPLSSLSEQEVESLWAESIATIRESYTAGGLTVSSYWDPNGRRGAFKNVIYRKELDPLGNVVVRTVGNGSNNRSTYWVPAVQR